MNFFTYIGIIISAILALLIVVFLLNLFWNHVFLKYIKPSAKNLWFALFGVRELKGKYLQLWWDKYAHRPGTRKHFKSWRNFKRLAYRRFIIEARKELHAGVTIQNDWATRPVRD